MLDEMDIVYFVKDTPTNEELRYSLRSVEKNFPHRYIWFVGGKPDALEPDGWLKVDQVGDSKWEKTGNLMKAMCNCDKISENFVVFDDDFFVMKKVEELPYYSLKELGDRVQVLARRKNKSLSYIEELKLNERALKEKGLPTVDYDLHCPMIINKTEMREVFDQFPDVHMWRSIYCNYYRKPAEQTTDFKILEPTQTPDEDSIFLSTSDVSFRGGVVGMYIRESFPEKTKYEVKPLSIIIPVYNQAPWLKRCFDSVITALQNNDAAEVIVIDDGSTDGSGAICDAYDDRFTVIHTENFGVSAARNLGMSMAKGTYIAFLDADDVLLGNAITSMLEAAKKYPDKNIFQFNYIMNNKVVQYNKGGTYDCTKHEGLPNTWYMVWNKLYKRIFLEEHKIRFLENLTYTEDGIFNYDCFKFCPEIECIEDSTVTKHDDNAESLSRIYKVEDLTELIRIMLDMIDDNNDHDYRKLIYMGIRRFLDMNSFKKTFLL